MRLHKLRRKRFLMFSALLIGAELVFWLILVRPFEPPAIVSLFDDQAVKTFEPFAIAFERSPTDSAEVFKARFILSIDERKVPGMYEGLLEGLRLVFVTFGAEPVTGELQIVLSQGGVAGCAATIQHFTIVDNRPQYLDLGQGACAQQLRMGASAQKQAMDLRFTAPSNPDTDRMQIGVWGRRLSKHLVPQGAALVWSGEAEGELRPASGSEALIVAAIGDVFVGSPHAPLSPLSRLCWLWGFSENYAPLFAIVLNLCLLLGCGSAAVVWGGAVSRPSYQHGQNLDRSSGRFSDGSLMGAVGATVATLSFGLFWAFVTPPLQAPDEPDHVLTFIKSIESGDVAPFARYAQAVHFERIKFHPVEKFLSGHMEQPYPRPWARHVSAGRVDQRSPATELLWSVQRVVMPQYGKTVVSKESTGGVLTTQMGNWLLSFRLANVVFIAICVFAAVYVFSGIEVRTRRTATASALLAVTLSSIPVVAFFFMMVSTYTVMIGGYLLLSLAVAAFAGRLSAESEPDFAQSPPSDARIVGALVGLVVGLWLTLAGGAAGIVAVAVSGSMLLLMMVSCASERMRLAISAVLVMGVPLTIVVLEWLAPAFNPLGDGDLKLALQGLLWLSPFLWAVYSYLVRAKFIRENLRVGPALVAGSKGLTFSGGALLLYLTLVRPVDGLHNIEQSDLSAAIYVWDAIKTFTATSALGSPEYYLAETFWSGFGWLEQVWSPSVTKLLQLLTLLGLMRWLWASRPRLLAVACLCLPVVGVGLLAFGYHRISVNLHGRYLIGIYFLLMALAVPGWSRLLNDVWRWAAWVLGYPTSGGRNFYQLHVALIRFLAFAGVLFFHLFALEFIISRYFW